MQGALRRDDGYAMAALLVMLSVMSIVMATAMPVWHTNARREKEAELIFRGEQYARAVMLFQRRYAGGVPPTVDVLVNERFLRKRYKDPMTGEDFQIVGPGTPLPGVGGETPGAGAAPARPGVSSVGAQTTGARTTVQTTAGTTAGVIGVVSRSDQQSLRLYNGRDRYNQWVFLGTEMSATAGAPPGEAQPGAGRGGRGGVQPAPGGTGGRGAAPGGGRRGAPPPGGGGRGGRGGP
jgi:type II secretory pathway pseudopilin PulG